MDKTKILFFLFCISFQADASWFCEQAASEKMDNVIMSCGIGEAATEIEARKKALQEAFEEMDTICERSIDCKTMETLIEPQRNDCKKNGANYKCYRAVKAIITKTKRREPFTKGATLKPEQTKLDIVVKIDPKDLIVINNGNVESKKQCQSDLKPLGSALLDIGSKEKQDRMIDEAVKIPLDELCTPVHVKIMYLLAQNGIKHPVYTSFLMENLQRIEDPAADDRAYFILEYMQKLAPYEDKEWQTSMEAVMRSNKNSLYRLLPKIFFLETSSAKQQGVEKGRIDKLAHGMIDGKFGRPMPIDFDLGMELLLRSLKTYKSKENPWAAVYAFEKFNRHLKHSNSPKIHRGLETLYQDASDENMKGALNRLLAWNVKSAAPTHELSKEVMDYIQHFDSLIKKLDDEEDDDIKLIKMYQTHRQNFLKDSGEKLGQNLEITKQDYEIKARTLICIEHQISCGELVPSQERLQKLLTSKKPEKRISALELLIKMPKMAAKLEADIVQSLLDATSGKIDDTNALIKSTAEALAAIPTQNKVALKELVRLSLNSRLSMQYVRDQLGKNLEPFWIDELKSTNTRHHLVILQELAESKGPSKDTCLFLSGMEKKEQPYFIKDTLAKILGNCR